MTQPPPVDIIGLPLEQATQALQATGCKISIIYAGAPGREPAPGAPRVVRQRMDDCGRIEVLVVNLPMSPAAGSDAP